MKKGLGKGLNALIDSEFTNEKELGGVLSIKINEIEPNTNQPRKTFDDEKLQKLSESIKSHGIVQPIIVRKDENTYKIVAGERRWRAARIIGLTEVPVIVKELTSKEVMEVALIENLQREDLNPIEEAEAYDKLIRNFEMTHEDLSNRIGKSRPAITNTMRLLALSEKVKGYLQLGALSAGHARALLVIENPEDQLVLAEKIIDNELTVRDAEKLVKIFLKGGPKEKKTDPFMDEYIELEENLQNILGTKVKIVNNKKNKGKIILEYYSQAELDRLVDLVESINMSN